MWYVYFRGTSWKTGVTCRDEMEAKEIAALSGGEIIAEYHE